LHWLPYAALAAIGLINGQLAWAQASVAADTTRKFEVASLRPTPQGVIVSGIRVEPGGQTYRETNVTLKYMMTVAYSVKADQIVGAPMWMNTDHYDLTANAERPSSVEEPHTRLKNLLARAVSIETPHRD
jgi:uncharacterized protein (TIGR03435 family)